MPRTKGSKNRPKTNTIKDYASQIAEKQGTVASLNTEIVSIPGDSEPPFRRCSTAVPFSTIPRIRDSDTVIPVR